MDKTTIITREPRNDRQRAIKRANPQLLRSLRSYVWGGSYVGSFLRAVIADELGESVMYADEDSMTVLGPLALYCFHDMPSKARGSFDAYHDRRDTDGLVEKHGDEAAEYANAIGI